MVLNPSVLQVAEGGAAWHGMPHALDFLVRSDFPGQSNDLTLGGPLSGSLERVNPMELNVLRLPGSSGFVPRWLALVKLSIRAVKLKHQEMKVLKPSTGISSVLEL